MGPPPPPTAPHSPRSRGRGCRATGSGRLPMCQVRLRAARRRRLPNATTSRSTLRCRRPSTAQLAKLGRRSGLRRCPAGSLVGTSERLLGLGIAHFDSRDDAVALEDRSSMPFPAPIAFSAPNWRMLSSVKL
jgi:hypothetical protein